MLYKTFNEDRDYLVNKFRKPVLDPATGADVDDENFRLSIIDLAKSLEKQGFSRPVIKAKCFEHVCRNIRIDVNPHDCFPGFCFQNRTRRPLDWLVQIWHDEEDVRTKENADQIYQYNNAGFHSVWRDFDHSVPDWNALIELGFPGLRDRAEEYRKKHEVNGTLTPEVAAHFEGMKITINAVLENIRRLIDYAEQKHPDNPRIQREVECLKRLRDGAPQNFYDVLQLIFLHFFYCEHIDRYQVRSLAGPLDDRLLPFYQRDLENGTFTMEDIREFLTCFLMQWGSIDNYWGHPVYLGGTGKNGESLYNELSYLILEIFEDLAIPTPKIHLKIARNTPEKLLNTAFRMLRDKHSSLTFISEEGIKRTLMSWGCSEEEARTTNIHGCYEATPQGKSNSTGAGCINMVKIFELLLNDGRDPKTGIQLKNAPGKLENITTFDDFYKVWINYLGELIEQEIKMCSINESALNRINPSLLYSITVQNSLETGKDAFFNGNIYNISAIGVSGFGTAIDALMAVKRFVFEKKEVSLTELRDILNRNWEGAEKLRTKILNDKYRYGNGIPEVDFYSEMISHFIGNKINMRPNSRNGFFLASGHNARGFVTQGEKTGATPDGRLAGEEISKNLSPTMGMDRNGITALIKSVTSMDSIDFAIDFPLDAALHPATVQGEEGLAALRSLLFTYFDRNGTLIQFNIFDAEELEEAQKNPEKYANLQIRVCGWNVRFVELSKVEQDAYIKRQKNLME